MTIDPSVQYMRGSEDRLVKARDPEPHELAGLLRAREILASIGYECSIADRALEAEVARIRAKGGNVAPREPDAPDGGGDEVFCPQSTVSDHLNYLAAFVDGSSYPAGVKADAEKTIAALRRATLRDGGRVPKDLRALAEAPGLAGIEPFRSAASRWVRSLIAAEDRARLATESGEGGK